MSFILVSSVSNRVSLLNILFLLFLKNHRTSNNYGELLFHVKLHLAQ